jgi:hypothetical protein
MYVSVKLVQTLLYFIARDQFHVTHDIALIHRLKMSAGRSRIPSFQSILMPLIKISYSTFAGLKTLLFVRVPHRITDAV